jgi:hypothetical protein
MRSTITVAPSSDSSLRPPRGRRARSPLAFAGLLVAALLLLAAVPTLASAAEAVWTEESPAASPSPRADIAIGYDGATEQLILFGGLLGGADTWEWNGTDWVQLSPATSPSARNRASMTYDAATGQLILFGGETAGQSLSNQTWEWKGGNWVQLSPVDSPPALKEASMAYDAATEQVILFGGAGGNEKETWEWNGTNWRELEPTTTPPKRTRASMAYDDATGQLILFGGLGESGSDLTDTWNWDGSNWTKLQPSTHPPGVASAPTAYVPITDKILIQGGLQDGLPSSEPWAWDGSEWALENPAVLPPPRGETSMAYDAADEEVVLFGGFGNPEPAFGDTWTYHSAPSPTATITSPAGLQTYTQGERVPTSFGCADAGGAGIGSCVDSNGASGGAGTLDTSTVGPHTYTVTALSIEGLRGEASISYTVVAAPVTPPGDEPAKHSSPAPASSSTPPPALGGYFGLKAARRNLAAGSARLAVKFTGSGEVKLTAAGVKTFVGQVGTGTSNLPIVPTAALKAKLRRTGKAKVTVTVSFKTPGNVWTRKKKGLVLRLKG